MITSLLELVVHFRSTYYASMNQPINMGPHMINERGINKYTMFTVQDIQRSVCKFHTFIYSILISVATKYCFNLYSSRMLSSVLIKSLLVHVGGFEFSSSYKVLYSVANFS